MSTDTAMDTASDTATDTATQVASPTISETVPTSAPVPASASANAPASATETETETPSAPATPVFGGDAKEPTHAATSTDGKIEVEGVPDEVLAEALRVVTGGPDHNKRERGATVPVRETKKKKTRNLEKFLQNAFGMSVRQQWAHTTRKNNDISLFKEVIGRKTRADERRAAILDFGKFKAPFVTRANPVMPAFVKLDSEVEHPVTTAQMRGALADIGRPLLHLQYVVAYLLHHGKLQPRKYKNFQLLRDTESSQGKDILVQKILSEPPEMIAEMYDLLMRVDAEVTARTKRIPTDKIKAYEKWNRNRHVFLAGDDVSKVDAEKYTTPMAPYHYIPRDAANYVMAKMDGRDDTRLFIHKPKYLLGGRWEDPELKKEWEEQLRKVDQQKNAAKKQTKRNTKGVDTYEDDDAPFIVLNDDDDDDDDDDNNTDDENAKDTDGKKKKKKGRRGKKTKKKSKKSMTREEKIAEVKKQFADMEDLCGRGMDEFLNWASEAALYMHESNIDQYDMDLARLMRLRQHHCPAPMDDLDLMRERMKTSEDAAEAEAKAEREAFLHDRKMTHRMKQQFKKMAMDKEGGSRIDEDKLEERLNELDGELIIDVEKLKEQGLVEGIDFMYTGEHVAGEFASREMKEGASSPKQSTDGDKDASISTQEIAKTSKDGAKSPTIIS